MRLDVSEELVDLETEDPEVAIRYGRTDWAGASATRLLADERLLPVASPCLLAAQPELHDPATWCHATLIRDATISNAAYPGWPDMLSAVGIDNAPQGPVIEMNAAMPAMDAAERGQGIALLREHLLQDALDAGRLVWLGDGATVDTGWSYYLLTRQSPSQRARKFAEWALAALGIKKFT